MFVLLSCHFELHIFSCCVSIATAAEMRNTRACLAIPTTARRGKWCYELAFLKFSNSKKHSHQISSTKPNIWNKPWEVIQTSFVDNRSETAAGSFSLLWYHSFCHREVLPCRQIGTLVQKLSFVWPFTSSSRHPHAFSLVWVWVLIHPETMVSGWCSAETCALGSIFNAVYPRPPFQRRVEWSAL